MEIIKSHGSGLFGEGRAPLHLAAEHGHAKVCLRLLDLGAELNVGNLTGASPLYMACQEGHASVVAALLLVIPPVVSVLLVGLFFFWGYVALLIATAGTPVKGELAYDRPLNVVETSDWGWTQRNYKCG